MDTERKAIVMGATSGIGMAVARLLAQRGWKVGVAGRRADVLSLLLESEENIMESQCIDITHPDAPQQLDLLIAKMGGMNLYFHSSGIGYQNPELDVEREMRTVETNALGFTRMALAAFKYFENHPEQQSQLAVISSIARTRGLGAAPSYSATKRYVSHYLECLDQLKRMKGMKNLSITDIRPGFVRTPLLSDGGHYPLQLDVESVARKIVRGVEHRKAVLTIDWRYHLLVGLWTLVPRWLWVRMKIVSK